MDLPFADRRDAGRLLVEELGQYAHRPDVIVLGLPRGGVLVAREVAEALGVPLDVFIVRKLGVPGIEEMAMGAVASGGVRTLNPDVIDELGISDEVIDAVTRREEQEIRRREALYRDGHPLPDLEGRTVIIVDDGLATGATMRAAVAAVRKSNPAAVIVAAPVAASDSCRDLEADADEVICLATPRPFFGVGRWYDDFAQTTDEEVRRALAAAWREQPPSLSGGGG